MLDLSSRFQDPDRFFAELAATLDAMDQDKGKAFLARLVLVLANQVGAAEVLAQAMAFAKQNAPPPGGEAARGDPGGG